MERGRLEYQHGHDSAQVREFDRRAAEQKAAEDAAWWNHYSDVTSQNYGGGGQSYGQSYGTGGHGGSAVLGPAIVALIGAGCALLTLSVVLYGAWRFAAEAAHALELVWGGLFHAVLHPFDAGSALLVAGFLLSCAAAWTVARLFARYRRLHPTWRAVAVAAILAPGQILLWMAGSLLLSLPVIGPLLTPFQLQMASALPAIADRTPDVATATLAAALTIVGVPLVRYTSRAIHRSALALAVIGLRAESWLAGRRLVTLAGVATATLLILLALSLPKPPIAMPAGLWTYPALVTGAIFGWRVALVAAVLAIALAQPGYREMSLGFADGTALQRVTLWWAGFVGAAAAAGWLRPALPSNPGGELRMAILATLFGLGIGCLAMLIIEMWSVWPDYLSALALDYWTDSDFVPGFLPGFAVSTLLGALASWIIRNVARSLISRAAELERGRGMLTT